MEGNEMAFNLNSVVPWGRNMEEYKLMFHLNESDLSKRLQDLETAQRVLTMR